VQRSGCLIAVEGIDGAGKSTLARRLLRRLSQEGYQTRATRRYCQPGLTALWRRMLDHDAVTQREAALLAAADAAVSQQQVFLPALEAGEVIVADRYVYSHLVHFAARGVPMAVLEVWFAGFRVPDAILFVDVPAATARLRLAAKGKPDVFECGLDAVSGASIGQAWRRFGRQNLREAAGEGFRAYQEQLAGLYAAVLPPQVTYRLDGELDPAALCEKAWETVVRLLPARP
jgi:thymidylate kinase